MKSSVDIDKKSKQNWVRVPVVKFKKMFLFRELVRSI